MDIKPTVSVRVKTEDLVASVKRVALVAERNTPLRMLINEDNIALEAATGDQARASEAVEATSPTTSAVSCDRCRLQPALPVRRVDCLDPLRLLQLHGCRQALVWCRGSGDIDGDPDIDYKHVIMMRLPN